MRSCSTERHENLDELLRDPIVGRRMRSDGVDPADVRALLNSRRTVPPSLPRRAAPGLRRGARTPAGPGH